MRLIDVRAGAVRAVAVSPDGRFVSASGDGEICVFRWTTGEEVARVPTGQATGRRALLPAPQTAFTHHGWVAFGDNKGLELHRLDTDVPSLRRSEPGERFAGGVAVSPDGKVLVATTNGPQREARLRRWALPLMQPLRGFDGWSPFRRLAFSPNGQYLAGITPDMFELRFAVSGGYDHRYHLPGDRPHVSDGFVSFTHDSETCVFGWEGEFHVLDLSTGTSRRQTGVEAPARRMNPTLGSGRHTGREVMEFAVSFRDAAFTGSGRHFATVEQPGRWAWWDAYEARWQVTADEGTEPAGRLKLWDPRTWQVVREYDWGCGPLTCLAFTADGLAGVCGTADGRLVQFDVDE